MWPFGSVGWCFLPGTTVCTVIFVLVKSVTVEVEVEVLVVVSVTTLVGVATVVVVPSMPMHLRALEYCDTFKQLLR